MTINEHASALNLVTSVTTQVECREASTGAITARVTGGIPNSAGEYRLILSGGPAGTSRDVVVNAGFDFVFDNLPAGTYSLRVIDDSNPLRVAYRERSSGNVGDDNFSVGMIAQFWFRLIVQPAHYPECGLRYGRALRRRSTTPTSIC